MTAYDRSKSEFNQSRLDSEKAMRYVNNDSWDSTDYNKAVAAKKPALKYPVLMPILSAIIGNEQLSAKRGHVKANHVDSVPMVDVAQNRWNMLNDEQDIEEKIQLVFSDALITKMGGFMERRFVVNELGYLDFDYRVANNMRVHLDPETKTSDYLLDFCGWLIKESWDTLEVLRETYGEEAAFSEEKKINWWWLIADYVKKFKAGGYSNDGGFNKENNTYQRLEMEERVTKKYIKAWDGSSFEYVRFTPKDYLAAKKSNTKLQMIKEDYDSHIQVTTLIPFFENLIVMDEVFQQAEGSSNFSLFPLYSYSLSTQVSEATSAMDMMLDVQDDINKGKSQLRDYIQQIVSAITLVASREKDLLEKIQRNKGQPGQIYGARDTENALRKFGPDNIPPEILIHGEQAYEFLENITGIGKAIFGQSERSGESGVLFEKKVQRAAAVINPYYKNVSRLRKALLRDFIDNFGFVYADSDRLVQLRDAKGIQGQTYLNVTFRDNQGIEQTLNSTKNLSFYVELDEGQDSITAREENWENSLALFSTISNVNPDAASALIPALLEDAPIRNKDQWLELLQDSLQQQAGAGARQAQLDEITAMIQNASAERGIVNEDRKLQIEAENAATSREAAQTAQAA